VRLYLEVARRSFQRHLAYRGATLAGLWANTVFGVLLASVFGAFYRSQGGGSATVAGFELAEILTFIWIGQSMIMVLYMWGWWEVATAVQSGDIVTDLMKPFDYFGYWLSRDLGRAACHVLTRFLPTFLVGLLLYDLALPGVSLRWLAFAISIVLAVVVSFAWRFMVNLGAFWMTDVRGIGYLTMLPVNFFSGFLVPIAFFPSWLRVIADVLPFRAMSMLPVEIMLGHGGIATALALQAFWAVALCLLARLMLGAATRKLVVQGG
jgi:ABC-2 type transport system permease protein